MRASRKNELTISLIALLVCVTMLIGTTFAWFTDTASTGVNKIAAGNLDMAVSYKNADTTAFTAVDEKTSVFKDGALWEPGHVEYAVLKIENIGTLAFEYNLGIRVASETKGTNVAGEEFALSESLRYAVLAGDVTEDPNLTRASLLADCGAGEALGEYSDKAVLLPQDKATATEPAEKVATFVVFMPETVGNEANHLTGTGAPTVELGITVNATQTPYETDSFSNDYDKNAAAPATKATVKFTSRDEFDRVLDGASGKYAFKTLSVAGVDCAVEIFSDCVPDVGAFEYTLEEVASANEADFMLDVSGGRTVYLKLTLKGYVYNESSFRLKPYFAADHVDHVHPGYDTPNSEYTYILSIEATVDGVEYRALTGFDVK